MRSASVCRTKPNVFCLWIYLNPILLFSFFADVHIEEVVGWPSPSRSAQNGTELPEPLVRQLDGEFANVSTSTVCALGGSYIECDLCGFLSKNKSDADIGFS